MQTEAKLRRDKKNGIAGQTHANATHKTVGKEIRKTINSLGGTMPENEEPLEHIREAKKRLKNIEPGKLGPTNS